VPGNSPRLLLYKSTANIHMYRLMSAFRHRGDNHNQKRSSNPTPCLRSSSRNFAAKSHSGNTISNPSGLWLVVPSPVDASSVKSSCLKRYE